MSAFSLASQPSTSELFPQYAGTNTTPSSQFGAIGTPVSSSGAGGTTSWLTQLFGGVLNTGLQAGANWLNSTSNLKVAQNQAQLDYQAQVRAAALADSRPGVAGVAINNDLIKWVILAALGLFAVVVGLRVVAR